MRRIINDIFIESQVAQLIVTGTTVWNTRIRLQIAYELVVSFPKVTGDKIGDLGD